MLINLSSLDGCESDFDKLAAGVANLGVGVLRGVLTPRDIKRSRAAVLDNLALMKNTRPTPSARHLAGFHRYPQLEPLHAMLTGHPKIRELMKRLCGEGLRTIGISDITVNRSQPWHKDLLRGQYRHLLDEDCRCSKSYGSVFKVLVYLQASASLRYIVGSHRKDISLESDLAAEPDTSADVRVVEVAPGDAVILDICTTHRGSDEKAYQCRESTEQPRILVSTVFGRANCPLTDQMEVGNAIRLADWERRPPAHSMR